MSRLSRKRRLARASGVSVVVKALAALLASVLLVAASAATLVLLYVAEALHDLPDMDDPAAFRVAQPTKIYSADNVLLASFYLENREIVPLSQISTNLVNAVVAVEDERYFQHEGVDTVGIARALLKDLIAGNTREGASTITQQYIRNTILSNERTEISLRRKIREAYLAQQLEKRYSKTQILEMYLNTIYFGDGAYGAQAAALDFFAKPATDLTMAEAALLAGLPQSPNALNPYYNPAGAKERRRTVLDAMVANGYITRAEADEIDVQEIAVKRQERPEQGIYACPYFVAHVRKVLLTQYSDTLVFKGGLKVYTTIDTRLQSYAEEAVRGMLNRPNDPDAALVSIDPRNGYILAMYGGKDYWTQKYNTATQGRRQPGSAFKTFVLVTALEAGIPPKRVINASSPAYIPTKPPWRVSNSEGSGRGGITIASATAHSVNVVFARLCWELGAAEVARTAKRMGIQSNIPALPSIALGSAEVTPLEMASAYGTLAANGVHNKPTAIVRIVDADGKTVFRHTPSGDRVLTPEISWATTELLMGVINGGTGKRAALKGRQVAGKTGTAQNYQDAWFVGYTPQMVTSVWMGYSHATVPMRNVHGQRAFGGTFCAPIWRAYMARALDGQPALKFDTAGAPPYKWRSGWSSAVTGTSAGEGAPAPPAPAPTPPPADPTPAPEPPPSNPGTSSP